MIAPGTDGFSADDDHEALAIQFQRVGRGEGSPFRPVGAVFGMESDPWERKRGHYEGDGMMDDERRSVSK